MLWRDPLYLWFCVPAVLVLGGFLYVRLRRRAAVLRAFADAPLVPRLTPDADDRRTRWRMAVRISALVLIAVAFGAGFVFGRYYPWLKHELTEDRPVALGRDQSARLRRLHERWEAERTGFDNGRGTTFYRGTDAWRRE